MTTLHVSPHGDNTADGSAERPLRTIGRAADLAFPGDTVLVHEGEYREWVRPRRGGLDDHRRIVYQAAPGESAVIKGSERIEEWTHHDGDVWRAEVDNALFGEFNPFAETVDGDWIMYDDGESPKHLGEVYLNGISFYEAASIEDVVRAQPREHVFDRWTGITEPVRDVARTRLQWFAQVDARTTTIWASFAGADPRTELVEINVRPAVFFPTHHHLDYITVRGFELAQAATPWVPPTADQPGLIGPNWAKGWIIEDNVIRDAKCSAISIGKEHSTGHNHFTERGDRPGYQYQIESVFAAAQIGWDKDHVGSHVIRRNTIHDCGQNGIVGHLGGVFSTIEDNHIYNIGIKREFVGAEIAGIKLHAPIDVTIAGNRIHACTLGLWLDWQTQGTRVSRNVLYDNRHDLFVEVSHGPYVVDNNVLGSPASLEIVSQGGAYVGNLFLGTVFVAPEMDRATPYHRPHSTQVAGFATIHTGDDRFIGNVFLASDRDAAYGPQSLFENLGTIGYGTAAFDSHPPSFQEYLERISEQPAGTHRRYIGVRQPVYIRGNVYGPGATPYAHEEDALVLTEPLRATLSTEDDAVYLELDVPASFDRSRLATVTTDDLPPARFADASFDDTDGSPLRIDTDLLGAPRTEQSTAGPLGSLRAGKSRFRLVSTRMTPRSDHATPDRPTALYQMRGSTHD